MYIPTPDTVYVGMSDGRLFRAQWSGSAWGALTALTHPAQLGHRERHRGGSQQRVAHLGDPLHGRRRARLPVRRRRQPLDRLLGGRPSDPADDRGRGRQLRTPTGSGSPPTSACTRASRRAPPGRLSASLPNALVGDLLFHPNARVLRAGTRNRGVWEIPVDGWLTRRSAARSGPARSGRTAAALVHLQLARDLARRSGP